MRVLRRWLTYRELFVHAPAVRAALLDRHSAHDDGVHVRLSQVVGAPET
ncbi:hypothetical protein [Schaalia canis]|nr:hypothetical protein [Schaalia canis]